VTESYWNRGADPYQYPGSQVLRNLPGINDASALEVFEQRASALRLDEMLAAIADKSINLALWQTIHRILFQDVYDWAGNIRLVQLAKGDTVFAMPERIEVEVNRLFAALERENLPSLNRDQIVARLAHYFGELNVLHPFREGNGRTQKLLFDEIVRRAGYAIDWAKMDVDALLKAVIAAFQKQDYHALERLFIHAIGD
jgi:cell filamentation protein